MLQGMRMQVEVRGLDREDKLRRFAFTHRRTVREEAGYLLELKLDELPTIIEPDAADQVVEVA